MQSDLFNLRIPKSNMPRLTIGANYSSRERVPAKVKNKVRARAHNQCEVCHTKPRGVTLEFHHKNMKNNDHRVSNIQLLCPNHHRGKHAKQFRRVYRDALGRRYSSRLVKKKPKTHHKRRRRRSSNLFTPTIRW